MTDETFSIELRGQVVIARMKLADMTSLESDQLLAELLQYWSNIGSRYFVLDMSEVEFIDSACIGSLVTFLINIDKSEGKLALACCREEAKLLIELTGLAAHITIMDSVDEAVSSLMPCRME